MKSWKIGRLLGVTIELHWTTLLFIIFLLILNPTYSLVLGILFLIISLHELAHSVVARKHGIKVQKIILLPIGGMAVMEESSIKPKAEFYMAIAGPMFNFLFAFLVLLFVQGLGLPVYQLSIWNSMLSGEIPLDIIGLVTSSLFWLNWLLGAFNLFVPAIPMDGGRVLRALLAMFLDYVTATKIAAYLSKAITAIMFLIALATFSIILLLISVFIYLGASAEIEQAININVLSRINIQALIKKRATIVKPGSTVLDVIRLMARRNITQVFVGGPGRAVTVEDLRNIKDTTLPVIAVARKVRPVRLTALPDQIFKAFIGQDLDILPVVRGRELVGFIYLEDLERAMRLAKAIYNV